ncbi:MAG: phosphatase PAP2 family protein [Acidimicrobiales bacterium]|nr:phosphatase PAP2 family protein [Acidimicrobiales bacterium]
MTATTETTTTVEPATPRLRWWRELITIGLFYGAYTLVRNQGIAQDSEAIAREHADQVIRFERFLGSYHEETIQEWFLGSRWFIQFWNIFYGTAHFVVTIVAIVWLFRYGKDRYPTWRNTLAVTVALALLGFTFYPLMPPRLMPPSFGFVDTLKDIGGLWSFDSGAMAKVSNQYAAMPSLHFGWSSWCALVLTPMIKQRWGKALMISYPFVTLFCIVVTGNHFWADALGGAIALGLGYLIGGKLITNAVERRTVRKVTTAAPKPPHSV